MYPEDRDEVIQIYLDDIIPNRFQPREVFDEKALKELAVSIKEHGVIQPIIVRRVNGKYEIIAGERRYKASALAGLTKIPAIVRDLDDKESSKVALLENLQRKNLNPIEEARTYQKILEIDQMTQEELAKTMGKSQSAVANKIRLLSLPDITQEALLKEQISERHARTMINVPAEKHKDLLKKIIDTKMSVRALEDEIKQQYPKENSDLEKSSTEISNVINSTQITASTSDFVNNNPLMPTADIKINEESNYGKVVIAPPEGEDMPVTNRFLNYEEEDDEEIDDTVLNLPSSITSIDVNQIKNNSTDINSNPGASADLDSLLNLNANITGRNEFITPAEKIVKANPIEKQKNSGDYFKTNDFDSIELPQSIINPQQFIEPETNSEIKEEYNVDTAIEKIRTLITELKNNGININLDEMNFDKTYQVIIKIDKE